MPNPDNLLAPFSLSTSALPGTLSFGFSGTSFGTRNASIVSSHLLQNSNSDQRNALLAALELLSNANQAIQAHQESGLDLFPEALDDLLNFIHNGAASSAIHLLLSPIATASHIAQLPFDVKASVKAIINTANEIKSQFDTQRASTLDIEKEIALNKAALSANCRMLCEQLHLINHQLKLAIRQEFDMDMGVAKTHANMAQVSATLVTAGSLGTAGVGSLAIDLIGSFFREISATGIFSKQESEAPKAQNIYQAFLACTQTLATGKDSKESFEALQNLEHAIRDCDPATELFDHHKVSSPSVSVLLRMLVSEPFVLALMGFNVSSRALAQIPDILTKATQARRISDGVDGSEMDSGFKFNLSFFSNASRLAEQSMQSATLMQTSTRATYIAAESAFSRSLVVALCHSGALTEMLRRLIAEEQERLMPVAGAMVSAQISNALIPRWENNIREVLNNAEINRNPIPGLNIDMASSLAAATNSTIAAALSTHSIMIAPFIKSIAASRKASVIRDAEKNEALSGQSSVSDGISTVSNIIQAFTKNFKDEIQRFADPYKNSSMAQTGDSLVVESMVISSGVSLLIEEVFEMAMSRSITLTHDKKVSGLTAESFKNMQKETGLFSDGIAEDSGWGEEHGLSHAVSAMRLTLSHLGVALGNFASELELRPETLIDNLELHQNQRRIINSMASALSHCSSAMLGASAVLSNLPMSSAGSIESLRESLQSFDHSLSFENTHCSEDYTKTCGSDTTLLTGMAADSMINIFSFASKLLLKSSVLGAETALSIAKIMEILSLHPRPEQAFALEMQRLSQPGGSAENSNAISRGIEVGSSVGTAVVAIATGTRLSQSTHSTMLALQKAVDQQIAQVALLEDEEETEETIGLKAFYKLLIQTLMPDKSAEEYDNLVDRFNHGGIALTGYHSDYHGIARSSDSEHSNSLLENNRFLKCDDVAALQNKFINEAFSQENRQSHSILDTLKISIIRQGKLSTKAEQHWEFIVNAVYERLRQTNNRARFVEAGESRLNQQHLQERKEVLLHHWETVPVEITEEISADYEPVP